MNKFRLKDTLWMAYPLFVIYVIYPYLFWTYKHYITFNLLSKSVFIILLFFEIYVAYGLIPTLWRFIYTNLNKVYVIVEYDNLIIHPLFKPFKASKLFWRSDFDFSKKEISIDKDQIVDIKVESFNISGTWFSPTVRIGLNNDHQLNLLQAYFESEEVFAQFVEALKEKSSSELLQ